MSGNEKIRAHQISEALEGVTLKDRECFKTAGFRIAEFCEGSVSINPILVVSGFGGVGKSTFLRSLARNNAQQFSALKIISVDDEYFADSRSRLDWIALFEDVIGAVEKSLNDQLKGFPKIFMPREKLSSGKILSELRAKEKKKGFFAILKEMLFGYYEIIGSGLLFFAGILTLLIPTLNLKMSDPVQWSVVALVLTLSTSLIFFPRYFASKRLRSLSERHGLDVDARSRSVESADRTIQKFEKDCGERLFAVLADDISKTLRRYRLFKFQSRCLTLVFDFNEFSDASPAYDGITEAINNLQDYFKKAASDQAVRFVFSGRRWATDAGDLELPPSHFFQLMEFDANEVKDYVRNAVENIDLIAGGGVKAVLNRKLSNIEAAKLASDKRGISYRFDGRSDLLHAPVLASELRARCEQFLASSLGLEGEIGEDESAGLRRLLGQVLHGNDMARDSRLFSSIALLAQLGGKLDWEYGQIAISSRDVLYTGDALAGILKRTALIKRSSLRGKVQLSDVVYRAFQRSLPRVSDYGLLLSMAKIIATRLVPSAEREISSADAMTDCALLFQMCAYPDMGVWNDGIFEQMLSRVATQIERLSEIGDDNRLALSMLLDAMERLYAAVSDNVASIGSIPPLTLGPEDASELGAIAANELSKLKCATVFSDSLSLHPLRFAGFMEQRRRSLLERFRSLILRSLDDEIGSDDEIAEGELYSGGLDSEYPQIFNVSSANGKTVLNLKEAYAAGRNYLLFKFLFEFTIQKARPKLSATEFLSVVDGFDLDYICRSSLLRPRFVDLTKCLTLTQDDLFVVEKIVHALRSSITSEFSSSSKIPMYIDALLLMSVLLNKLHLQDKSASEEIKEQITNYIKNMLDSWVESEHNIKRNAILKLIDLASRGDFHNFILQGITQELEGRNLDQQLSSIDGPMLQLRSDLYERQNFEGISFSLIEKLYADLSSYSNSTRIMPVVEHDSAFSYELKPETARFDSSFEALRLNVLEQMLAVIGGSARYSVAQEAESTDEAPRDSQTILGYVDAALKLCWMSSSAHQRVRIGSLVLRLLAALNNHSQEFARIRRSGREAMRLVYQNETGDYRKVEDARLLFEHLWGGKNSASPVVESFRRERRRYKKYQLDEFEYRSCMGKSLSRSLDERERALGGRLLANNVIFSRGAKIASEIPVQKLVEEYLLNCLFRWVEYLHWRRSFTSDSPEPLLTFDKVASSDAVRRKVDEWSEKACKEEFSLGHCIGLMEAVAGDIMAIMDLESWEFGDLVPAKVTAITTNSVDFELAGTGKQFSFRQYDTSDHKKDELVPTPNLSVAPALIYQALAPNKVDQDPTRVRSSNDEVRVGSMIFVAIRKIAREYDGVPVSARGHEYVSAVTQLFYPVDRSWERAISAPLRRVISRHGRGAVRMINTDRFLGASNTWLVWRMREDFMADILHGDGFFTRELTKILYIRRMTLFPKRRDATASEKAREMRHFVNNSFKQMKILDVSEKIYLSINADQDPRKMRTFESMLQKIFGREVGVAIG